MVVFIDIFDMNENKPSFHMDQISQHINYTNRKIDSYDQMIKVIVTYVVRNVVKMMNPLLNLLIHKIHH